MPILGLQKRSRDLGRIRLGRKGDRGQPQKLETFRITAPSKALIEKVAVLYGGEVQPWTPEGKAQQWEVITDVNRVPILVPPQAVSQWHEAWRKSGIVHKCDGYTNVLDDEPCDPDDPLHQEAIAKPTTRLNVLLRDVEGLGVFRVETKGWYAAMELPAVAEFLAQAEGYVEAHLSLEQRTSIDQSGDRPQTRHYSVPIIEVDVTPAQLLAGGGRVQAPSVEGPVARPAIEAGLTKPAEEKAVLPTADDIAGATSVEVIRSIWTYLAEHDALTDDLKAACNQRAADLTAAEENADGTVDAQVVDDAAADPAADGDADAIWAEMIRVAGSFDPPMTTSQVTEQFTETYGMAPAVASAAELQKALDDLKGTREQVSA